MLHKLVYKQGNELLPLTPENGIILTDIDGLTVQNVTLDTTSTINGIGETVNAQTVASKNISLSGVLTGASNAKRKALLHAVVPTKAAELQIDDTYKITVYPTQTPDIERYDRNANFSVMLRAPYPYFELITATERQMNGIQGKFTFPCELTSFMLGEKIDLVYQIVENAGSVPCGFICTITATGTVENPFIQNMDTGETVTLKKTLTAGESLRYAYQSGRVTVYHTDADGNQTNAFSCLDIAAVPFELACGDNPIKIGAASGAGLIEATILFYPAYTGVES